MKLIVSFLAVLLLSACDRPQQASGGSSNEGKAAQSAAGGSANEGKAIGQAR